MAIATFEDLCLHHRLLYTWIGHEIFGTGIRVLMGSNGSKISEV